jgi:hypothetical protein
VAATNDNKAYLFFIFLLTPPTIIGDGMLYPFCKILLEDKNRRLAEYPKFNLYIGEGVGFAERQENKKDTET